jgi:outer membrane lipoprotein-sorting protein
MMSAPKASRRSRWAVPAALAAAVVVTAVTVATAAAASPSLPPQTPAQLLTALATHAGSPPPMSGQVVVSADLGIPQLPGQDSPSSILSLLAGSHSISLSYADPTHYRLALPVPLGETDVIRNGGTAWIWQSSSDSVTQLSPPANGGWMYGMAGQGAAGSPSPSPVTPQQAVRQLLSAVGPSTSVTTSDTTTVAGENAYQLVVKPRQSGSLIGSVVIAVDAQHPGVVLSVQVFAAGATTPAWSESFSSITFATPDASTFRFTPPQGATVHTVTPPAVPGQQASPQPAGSGMKVIGKDWLSVLELPASAVTGLASGGNAAGAIGQAAQSAAAGPGSGPGGGISGADIWSALLNSATTVHGSFGSGQLIRTGLLSILITNGHVFVGAVDPSVLYGAAAQAG